MSGGLYRPEVDALLGAGVLAHTARLEVSTPDAVVSLPVLTGSTWDADEDRSPRFTATIRTPLPAQGLFDQLDPRTPSRVVLFAGYKHPDWVSDGVLLDGVLVDRQADRPANTMTLSIASAEQVVIDDAATPASQTVLGGSQAGIALRIVNLAFATARTFVDTTSSPSGFPAPDLVNNDKWDMVRDNIDAIGADIFADTDGVWHIDYRTTAAGAPVFALTTGPGGNVTRTVSRTSRAEGYANRVQLVYEWRNAAGTDARIMSLRQVNAGQLAAVAGNVVTFREVRNVPATQATADAAAAALVARLANRGQLYQVSAAAAYWLRPPNTVSLALPTGGLNLIVSSIRHQLGTGIMDLTLRVPDLTSTIGAPP